VTVISAPRLLVDRRLTGPGAVVVDGGHIAAVLDEVPAPGVHHLRLEHGVLTPGLLDLHNNGAFGVDFAEATPAQWGQVLADLASRGVTGVQPTVITAPPAELTAAAHRCRAAARAQAGRPVARILGVHFEGPFISETRRGAHRPDYMLDPDAQVLDALLRDPATAEMLATITLAPERPHALDATRRLVAAGVVVAVGHSDATAGQVREAADAGATMITHVFNAQRPFAHRDPGVPGAALTDDRLFVGLIVDGRHVDPLACDVVFRAARGRVVAVTDSILTAGLPDGTPLIFGGQPVTNDATGVGRRPDGTIAGAGIVLDEGVRRMVAAGLDPAMVLTAATETPARALGRTDLGRLEPGAHADLVWWDGGLHPRRTWIDGTEVAG
jgi:N-acetylglucosamine-6-phosphate deacetylase